jgi:hypothetical protein
MALPVIDLTDWVLTFGIPDPMLEHTNSKKTPKSYEYETGKDILIGTATIDSADRAPIQSNIQKRLKSDSSLSSWLSSRRPLSEAPLFADYQASDYDKFHSAARSLMNGDGLNDTNQIATELNLEIVNSGIIIPLGQTLFHGRCDAEPSNGRPYPAFVSTTIDPIVAYNSALRRADGEGTQTVYIFQTSCEISALLCHDDESFEFEILLPPGLILDVTSVTKSVHQDLTIIEADIIDQEFQQV